MGLIDYLRGAREGHTRIRKGLLEKYVIHCGPGGLSGSWDTEPDLRPRGSSCPKCGGAGELRWRDDDWNHLSIRCRTCWFHWNEPALDYQA